MITLWILWLSYKIEPGSQDSDEPRTGGPRYPGTSDPNRKPIICLCGQVPLLQFSTILICKDLSKILFPGATFIHRPWADSGKLGVKKFRRWEFPNIVKERELVANHSAHQLSHVHCTPPETEEKRTCTADGCLGSCETTGYCYKVLWEWDWISEVDFPRAVFIWFHFALLLIFTNNFSGDQEERHPPDQEIQVRVIIIIRKWLEYHTVVSWGYMSSLKRGPVVYCGF